MQVILFGRSRRYGVSRLDVLAIVGILVLAAAVILPQFSVQRTVGISYTCRNNIRALATALFNYSVRTGKYPGYLNELETNDGRLFCDPTIPGSTNPLPVSWAVMILPDIDRQPLFDMWCQSPEERKEREAREREVVPTDSKNPIRSHFFTNLYIQQFLCPQDPQETITGTPISYVLNTGLPDSPVGRSTYIDIEGEASLGTPRDWPANGMFFDNFTSGPWVVMTDDRIADPKDKTILLTENVDATSYFFRAATHGADNWSAAEVQTGCIWRPGTVDESKKSPTMTPPAASLQPNVAIGQGDGTSYDYCRPSSRHPGFVNVAFVGQNVRSLRDNISYYVLAKLMASDDENVCIPGRSRGETDAALGRQFRTRRLDDVDVWP